ncbi:MAG: hypothetical protein AAF517_23505, partial [Planctomycetota bacterium]
MTRLSLVLGLAGLFGLFPSFADAQSVQPVKVGDVCPDLEGLALQSRIGASRVKILKIAKERACAILFLDSACAAVSDIAPQLESVWRSLPRDECLIVGVYSNAKLSAVDVAQHASANGFTFPILRDPTQTLKTHLGARRTPELALLDSEHRLRFRGAMSDSESEPFAFLKKGLGELIAGDDLSLPATAASGCLIRRPRKPRGSGLTFEKLSPVLAEHCVPCHDGESGAFALRRPVDFAGRHRALERVLRDGTMPPSVVVPDKALEHTVLSAKDRSLLRGWIAAGAPARKDAEAIPLSAQYVYRTEVFRTDERLADPREKAAGHYTWPSRPAGRWVQAIRIEPQAGTTVRNATLKMIAEDGETAIAIANYSPGAPDTRFPDATALEIPAGASLALFVAFKKGSLTSPPRVDLEHASSEPERRIRPLELSVPEKGPATVKHRLDHAVMLHHAIPGGGTGVKL